VDESQGVNHQTSAPSDIGQASATQVEQCKTVVKLVKHGHVMAQKSQIVAEGWGPRGPYVVDGKAPPIYYSPGTCRQARYEDEWSREVHALFERLASAGWVHDREAASGKWWEQVFTRPVTARSAQSVEAAQSDAEWRPDPTSRHQMRYFNGTSWTDHVADAGVQAVDSYDASSQ
jgi:hypothetical protein